MNLQIEILLKSRVYVLNSKKNSFRGNYMRKYGNWFLDSLHKSFLNRTTLDLRKEKWTFLNQEVAVLTFLNSHMNFLTLLTCFKLTLLPYIYCKVDEKIRLLRWRSKGQKLTLKTMILSIFEYFL